MAPILYYSQTSPPARAVVLGIRYMDIQDIEVPTCFVHILAILTFFIYQFDVVKDN